MIRLTETKGIDKAAIMGMMVARSKGDEVEIVSGGGKPLLHISKQGDISEIMVPPLMVSVFDHMQFQTITAFDEGRKRDIRRLSHLSRVVECSLTILRAEQRSKKQ